MERAPQGRWYVDREIQQAQYLNKVNQACLPPEVKEFLHVIASVATWLKIDKKTGEVRPESYTPCYASQDTLQIYMNRCSSYITKAKKLAVEHGWIVYEHSPSYMASDWIWPVVGRDDPNCTQRVKREKPRKLVGDPNIEPIVNARRDIPNKELIIKANEIT